jgi:hypothetical protein
LASRLDQADAQTNANCWLDSNVNCLADDYRDTDDYEDELADCEWRDQRHAARDTNANHLRGDLAEDDDYTCRGRQIVTYSLTSTFKEPRFSSTSIVTPLAARVIRNDTASSPTLRCSTVSDSSHGGSSGELSSTRRSKPST